MQAGENKLNKLLKRLGAGDKSALSGIYDSMSKAIYITAYNILNNRQDAEDVLQNTMIELVSSAGSYRGDGAVSYVISTAKNHSLKLLSKRKYDMPIDETEVPSDDTVSAGTIMTDALMRLSDVDRKIVTDHVFFGLKFKDIGKETGLSADAAQKRYVRALQTLKEYYKESDKRDRQKG